MIREYYRLTKPGIIRGNMLSAIAGFFFASRGNIDVLLLIALLSGTAFVIACGCVINNYLDRDIDRQMSRTKKRALVTGQIQARNAFIFAAVLGLAGFSILFILVNTLTTLIGFIGLFAYVVLYGIGKRKTVHGTLIGTISGSVPPVAAYTAVTNQLDTPALVLFLILVSWQMPHFYAIAMFRIKDYKAARIPVLPIVKGNATTKRQIGMYIVSFIIATTLLTTLGYATVVYAAIMLLAGIYWLYYWRKNIRSQDSEAWAKKLFLVSLNVLLIWVVAISADSFFIVN